MNINIDDLLKYNINAHQWVWAELCITNQNKLNKYANKFELTDKDVEQLKQNNIFEEYDKQKGITSIKLSEKWTKKFWNTDWFQEFYDAYPATITDKYGVRRRMKTTSSKEAYLNKVKSQEMHNQIMWALKREIKEKTDVGKMEYMKTMSNYIKDEEWKKYEDEQEQSTQKQDNKQEEKAKYGEMVW